MVKYILISGKINSGKTTFANIIQNRFPDDVIISHFSDIPKKEFCQKFNYDLQLMYESREYKEHLRPKLIEYAESHKHLNGKDIWAKILVHHIPDSSKIVVIPDLRLIEELDYFIQNNLDFIIIRINRIGTYKQHFTETQFDNYTNFDFIYDNNSSFDELRNYAINFIIPIIKECHLVKILK